MFVKVCILQVLTVPKCYSYTVTEVNSTSVTCVCLLYLAFLSFLFQSALLFARYIFRHGVICDLSLVSLVNS